MSVILECLVSIAPISPISRRTVQRTLDTAFPRYEWRRQGKDALQTYTRRSRARQAGLTKIKAGEAVGARIYEGGELAEEWRLDQVTREPKLVYEREAA